MYYSYACNIWRWYVKITTKMGCWQWVNGKVLQLHPMTVGGSGREEKHRLSPTHRTRARGGVSQQQQQPPPVLSGWHFYRLCHNVSQTNSLRCADFFQKAAEEARRAARTRSIVHDLQAFPGWARKTPAPPPRYARVLLKPRKDVVLNNTYISVHLLHLAGETGIRPTSHNSPRRVRVWPSSQSQVPDGQIPPSAALPPQGSGRRGEPGGAAVTRSWLPQYQTHSCVRRKLIVIAAVESFIHLIE